MNRNIVLILVAGLVLAALGGIAFAIALYFVLQGPELDPGRRPPPRDDPPPLTYLQLEDLHDNPAKAEKEIPKIIGCFKNGDEALRILAAETLAQVGAKAVEPLRAKLTAEDAETRFGCVQALAFLRTEAAPAVAELLVCVHDVDPRVRFKAVYALGRTGVKSPAVFKALFAALDDLDERVPETAFAVLEDIGAPPRESLPDVAKIAKLGAKSDIRHIGFKLLGGMGEPAVPVFRELIQEVRREDEHMLHQAIGLLGADARGLIPELVPVMIRQVRDVNFDSILVGTFKQCQPEGARGLADVLKATDGEKLGQGVRPVLLTALGEMRTEASVKASVPILIELLKGNKSNAQLQILETLGDIGLAARDAIPAVEALVKDPGNRNDPAVVALRRMGKILSKPE